MVSTHSQAHSLDRQYGYQTTPSNQHSQTCGVLNEYYVHTEQSRNRYSDSKYYHDYDGGHATEQAGLRNLNVYQPGGPLEAQSRNGRSGTESHIRERYYRAALLGSKSTAGTACTPEARSDNTYKLPVRLPLLPTFVPLATGWDNPFPVFRSNKRPTRAGEQRVDGATGVLMRGSDPEQQAIPNRTLEENPVLQRVRGPTNQTPARMDPAQNGQVVNHPPAQDSSHIAQHHSQAARTKPLYHLDHYSNPTQATWDSHHQGVQLHNNPDKITRHTTVPYEHRQDSYDRRETHFTMFHNRPPAATDKGAPRTVFESMGAETLHYAPDQHSHNAYGNGVTATVLTSPTSSYPQNGSTVYPLTEAEASRLLPTPGSAYPPGLQNEVLANSGNVPWQASGVQKYGSLAQRPLHVPRGLPVAAQIVDRPSRALHEIALANESKPDSLPQHPPPVRLGLAQGTATPQSNRPPTTRQPFPTNGVVQGAKQHQLSTASVGSSERQALLPITHGELERLRAIVTSNPSDFSTQLLLAKRMVEAASVLADHAGRADPKTRNRNRERYILDAHKLVRKLVSHGYAEAMFFLADCYGRGLLGLEVDVKEAFTLYQSAAKAGHATAAYRTAVCCEMGPEEGGGTRKDPLKALQWYKRAATLRNVPAMYKVGMILLKGLLGQQTNPSEAVSWLKRAAERADEENPHALHELGILYETATPNDKLLRDEAYALQLFKQAAELNYKYAQCRLGQAYEYGQLGCAIHARSSIFWYTQAASQGEREAELALSGWYLTGSEGILEHSDTEAYLWARKAACAEPPLPKAMFAMGYYTEVGIGCPRSLEEAKRWYGRAASYKYPKAQERLEELKKGGSKVQKHHEKLSRNNQRQHEAECRLM